MPEPFTVADYRERTAALDVRGGAVVSGSSRRSTRRYLVDALGRLGPGFVGVTQLPAPRRAMSRSSSSTAPACGRCASTSCAAARRALRISRTLAGRAFALAGWHAEVYVDGRELAELEAAGRAGSRGRASTTSGFTRDGLPALLRLAGARGQGQGVGLRARDA